MIRPPPRSTLFPYTPLSRSHDAPHRTPRRDQTAVDVREVELAVVALLPTGEADGAPEALDVAQHFPAQGVHAGHPVTVQAPDQVVSHQPGELLTTDVHPVRVAIARQAHQGREDRVETQLGHAEDDEDGEGQRGHPESDVVVEPSDGAVEEGDDARPVHVSAGGAVFWEKLAPTTPPTP